MTEYTRLRIESYREGIEDAVAYWSEDRVTALEAQSAIMSYATELSMMVLENIRKGDKATERVLRETYELAKFAANTIGVIERVEVTA